jgi:hypothetical protein
LAAHAGYAAPTTGASIDSRAGRCIRRQQASAQPKKQDMQLHVIPTTRMDSLLRRRGGGTCATETQACARTSIDDEVCCSRCCAHTESGATTCVAKDAAREKLKRWRRWDQRKRRLRRQLQRLVEEFARSALRDCRCLVSLVTQGFNDVCTASTQGRVGTDGGVTARRASRRAS